MADSIVISCPHCDTCLLSVSSVPSLVQAWGSLLLPNVTLPHFWIAYL